MRQYDGDTTKGNKDGKHAEERKGKDAEEKRPEDGERKNAVMNARARTQP